MKKYNKNLFSAEAQLLYFKCTMCKEQKSKNILSGVVKFRKYQEQGIHKLKLPTFTMQYHFIYKPFLKWG